MSDFPQHASLRIDTIKARAYSMRHSAAIEHNEEAVKLLTDVIDLCIYTGELVQNNAMIWPKNHG